MLIPVSSCHAWSHIPASLQTKVVILSEWKHNNDLIYLKHIYIFFIPFHANRSMKMLHTGPLNPALRLVKPTVPVFALRTAIRTGEGKAITRSATHCLYCHIKGERDIVQLQVTVSCYQLGESSEDLCSCVRTCVCVCVSECSGVALWGGKSSVDGCTYGKL